MTQIQQALNDIKERTKNVLLKDLRKQVSDEFARGFRYCYTLFEIGFEKDDTLSKRIEQYNSKMLATRNEKLEKVVKAQRQRIVELNQALRGKGELKEVKHETFTHVGLAILKDIKDLDSITREEFLEIVNNRMSHYIKVK